MLKPVTKSYHRPGVSNLLTPIRLVFYSQLWYPLLHLISHSQYHTPYHSLPQQRSPMEQSSWHEHYKSWWWDSPWEPAWTPRWTWWQTRACMSEYSPPPTSGSRLYTSWAAWCRASGSTCGPPWSGHRGIFALRSQWFLLQGENHRRWFLGTLGPGLYRVSRKTLYAFVLFISRPPKYVKVPSWTFFNSPFCVDFKTIKFVIIWCNFDWDITKILKGSHWKN